MAHRDLERFLHFGWNAARYALGPLAAMLIPWVVMQRGSKSLWGDTVAIMITVQLASHILRWGSREMLPRLFAEQPARTGAIWMTNLVSRIWLVVPVAIALFFVHTATPLAVAWLLLLFLNNNFETLVVWRKRFGISFAIDAAGLLVTLAGIRYTTDLTLESTVLCVVIGQAMRTVLLSIAFARDLAAKPAVDVRSHLARAVPFLLIALSGLLGSRADLYVMGLIADRATLAEYQVVAGYFVQFQALAGIIAVPFTRELYRMGPAGVQKATGRLASLGLLILLPIGVIGHMLFTHFYGFDQSLWTIVAGCLVGWPVYAYTPMVQTVYKRGRELTMVTAGFATAAISSGLTWLLVPRFGITGGLSAAAISQFIMLIAVRSVFRRLASGSR